MPYLLAEGQELRKGIGKGGSEAVGKTGGEAVWDDAPRVWERIRDRSGDRDGIRAPAQSLFA
jgi:hypothetical protein